MKFLAAMLAIFVISLVISLGIWAAAHGHGLWFLVLGVAAFMGLFIRYGCQTH